MFVRFGMPFTGNSQLSEYTSGSLLQEEELCGGGLFMGSSMRLIHHSKYVSSLALLQIGDLHEILVRGCLPHLPFWS